MTAKTRVNVITGFLGSGKTTIIGHLLAQLAEKNKAEGGTTPADNKIVWLKNEYGDVNIDKAMLDNTHVKPVEILNGCLCCVLVGRLGDAIEEILEKYAPERIIIETSGTAYPAPIVLELNKLKDKLFIDSVVYVVDALNFNGFEDTSYSARLQTQYVDLIVINKYPKALNAEEERELEKRLDDIYELNLQTLKVKSVDGNVPLDLVFGLNSDTLSKLNLAEGQENLHLHSQDNSHDDDVQVRKLETKNVIFSEEKLNKFQNLDVRSIFRIKGVLRTASGRQIFNWVGNRFNLTDLNTKFATEFPQDFLIIMGKKLTDNDIHDIENIIFSS